MAGSSTRLVGGGHLPQMPHPGSAIVIYHILPWQYHDIALTTTAFDAEEATKHQFPLIIYIEMLKVLHCGFELELLKVCIVGMS